MNLCIEEKGDLILPFDTEEIARLVIEAALREANCPYDTEINLLLTTNEEVKEVNHLFRHIDKETDVLSFPMQVYTTPGDFSHLEEYPQDSFNLDTGELILGDIVISKDKVLAQAKDYGHSSKREYAFLIAHSMLHLFGYDHMEDEERLIMEAKQEEILNIVHILR